MKYLSLFTGIGGFEVAIQNIFPESECVGYSEIESTAIKIYESHFPTHTNLGDITKIVEDDIKGIFNDHGTIDLVVGGFPCTNLSSMANFNGDNGGLSSEKSGLFFNMADILKWVRKYNKNVKFIIENNNSMKKSQKEIITNVLNKIFDNVFFSTLNNADFGVQTRKRILWTNFSYSINIPENIQQTFSDVLEPLNDTEKKFLSEKMIVCLNKLHSCKNAKGTTKIVKKAELVYHGTQTWTFENIKVDNMKSRWDIHGRSDTMSVQLYTPYPLGKSRPIMASTTGGNNILLDRRCDEKEESFIPRYFTPLEIERLFGFEDEWTLLNGISITKRYKCLGNSIPIFIVKHVLDSLRS